MAPTEIVYIALGTNEGDRLAYLRAAITQIEPCVRVERVSTVYETEPAYVTDQPRYLNMALVGQTDLDPHALLACLKDLERQIGRTVGPRWGQRPIDLDIIIYGELQIDTPDLIIPHVRMHERAFVLEPLSDLAPDLVPPGQSLSVRELAAKASFGEILARLGPLDLA